MVQKLLLLGRAQPKKRVNFNKLILFIQTSNHYSYAGNLFDWWDLLEIPMKIFHLSYLFYHLWSYSNPKPKTCCAEMADTIFKARWSQVFIAWHEFLGCFFFYFIQEEKREGSTEIANEHNYVLPRLKMPSWLAWLGGRFQNIPKYSTLWLWQKLKHTFQGFLAACQLHV